MTETTGSHSFSHLNPEGGTRMVDVSMKPLQSRRALAEGILRCSADTIEALQRKALPKGDVLTVAQVAGIQAAKRTGELIPMCHPLPISHVEVSFSIDPTSITIRCVVATTAPTGVEMEALTGVSVAGLTLFDMCKAVDKTMALDHIRVVEKTKQPLEDLV